MGIKWRNGGENEGGACSVVCGGKMWQLSTSKSIIERYNFKQQLDWEILYLLRGMEVHLHVLLNHSKTSSWLLHSVLGILPRSQALKQSQLIVHLTIICVQLPRNEARNLFVCLTSKSKDLTSVVWSMDPLHYFAAACVMWLFLVQSWLSFHIYSLSSPA